MHKQRMLLALLSIIGIVSIFLPWQEMLSGIALTKTADIIEELRLKHTIPFVLNIFPYVGVANLLLFIISLLVSLAGNKSQRINPSLLKILPGLLSASLSILAIYSTESILSDKTMIGNYLSLAASAVYLMVLFVNTDKSRS